MERYFNTPEYVRVTEDRLDEEGLQNVFGPVAERVRRHEPEGGAEGLGGPVGHTSHDAPSGQAGGEPTGAHGAERPAEERPAAEAADSVPPELRRLFERMLAEGGGPVVERLQQRDEEMAAATCTQPELGRMIEAHYVPLLLSILELSDEEFDAEFPGEGRVSSEHRAALAAAVRRHASSCPRCSLKCRSNMELDEHLDEVFRAAGRGPRDYV